MAFWDSLTAFLPGGNRTPPPAQTDPEPGRRPYGASGRANFNGFISWDELNPKLQGTAGLEVFDQMYREDPDIKRNVSAIWTPIQAASFTVEPFGGDNAEDEDRKAAELGEWALFDHMSPNLTDHLATLGPVVIRSGFCDFEELWDAPEWEGKTVTVPKKLDLRLPRTIYRFFQDEFSEMTGVEQFLPNAMNVVIPASALMHYRLQAEGDNWTGTSLLRQAYKPWFYKTNLERIDAVAQERAALGVPLVYPPENASDEEKDAFEKILVSLQASEHPYIMAPGPKAMTGTASNQEGWLVEMIQFATKGDSGINESITRHQRAVASAFLADFLELGHHQVGARATAQVQEDPFLTAVEALGNQILGPLNTLLKKIAYLNFPNIKGAPTLKMSMHDVASLSEISSYVQQLVAAGAMQVDPETEDYLRERADLPAANADIRDEKEKLREAGQQSALEAAAESPQERAEKQKMLTPGKPAEGEKRKPDQAPEREAKGARKQLDTGDAKWWEDMLSQGRLVEALDGARDQMQTAATPATVRLARTLAQRGKAGRKLSLTPPQDLVEALQGELTRLYQIGHATVSDELAWQRKAMGTQLASGTAVGGAGLLSRARRRARVGAQHITSQTARAVERATTNGITDELALQRAAEQAATGALRVEAVANASQSVNDGRTSAARAATDVVGGIYTSVLDPNTCDECAVADDGVIREPDDAALEVPNGNCAGSERCRCMVVWVLSDDPTAIATALA